MKLIERHTERSSCYREPLMGTIKNVFCSPPPDRFTPEISRSLPAEKRDQTAATLLYAFVALYTSNQNLHAQFSSQRLHNIKLEAVLASMFHQASGLVYSNAPTTRPICTLVLMTRNLCYTL